VSVLAAIALASCASLPQDKLAIPKNDGWVTDLADMLPAQRERDLEARMESYRAGSSGAEIAVLTVPNLSGRSVEQFALETARAWGIGSEATSNGALLVIAREERALRIEVGRGLEGDVPDAIASRIINQVIVPRFKSGDFAGGIEAGVSALHAAIGGDYAATGLREALPKAGRGLATLLVFLVILAVSSAKRRGRGPRGRGPFGGLGLPLTLGGLGGLGSSRGGGFSGRGFSGGGGFGGFGGGGGFSGGGASGRW